MHLHQQAFLFFSSVAFVIHENFVLSSGIPPLGYIWSLLCLFKMQKQFGLFVFIQHKGWLLTNNISEVSASGNLQSVWYMFYLKTRTISVLKLLNYAVIFRAFVSLSYSFKLVFFSFCIAKSILKSSEAKSSG